MKCHIYPQQSMDRLQSSDILPVVSSVVSAAPDYPTPLDQCPSTGPPPGKHTYTDVYTLQDVVTETLQTFT